MRILVTGAAGFLGTNLCLKLLSLGHDVVGLDDMSSGQVKNVELLKSYENFSFLRMPVQSKNGCKVDAIYHLACVASPPGYQKNPIHTLDTCYLGTKTILQQALDNDCPVLFSSTSEVYGEPQIHPQVESYRGNVNTLGPRSCYDEGKRVAESLCYEYHKMGAKVKVVRIFNTYGPHMSLKDGRVITNFIQQAVSGSDITLYGDGEQTRSFCYVDDLINGFITIMEKGELGPYNLGNPVEVTVKQIAGQIVDITKSSSKLTYKPLPTDDPTKRCPDISKVNLLGWEPKIDLEDGLRSTIKHFT